MRIARTSVRLIVAALAVVMFFGVITPTQAATLRTWDRLAYCESGGRWHINTGNGYFGGLQFSRSTWRAYGGRQFAWRADHATRLQQIRVGGRVLRHQGWGAWPVCSRRIGVR